MTMTPPRKKQRTSLVSEQDLDPEGIALPTEMVVDTPKKENTETDTKSQQRQLFVRGLPASSTTESLTELFSENYPIKHALAVLDRVTKQCKGYGFVTFADVDDAVRAKDEFQGHAIEGKKLRIEIAESRQREDKVEGRKTPGEKAKEQRLEKENKERTDKGDQGTKLIVRNLPWTIKTEQQLERLFLSFGKIKSAQVVKKKGSGLLTGFGFVTMRGRKNAEKALERVNGTEVDGRTVAVDWAVNKDTYLGVAKPEEDGSEVDGEEEEDGKENGADEDGQLGIHEGEDDDEDDMDEDEDEDMDEIDKVDQEVDDWEEKNRMEDKSATLFIRNLPFTCEDEDLEEHFRQFGATRYARVVMDYATGRSKGTGFVAFYNVEDADECLKNAPRPAMPKPMDGKNKSKGRGKDAPQMHSVLQDETIDVTGRFTLDGRVLSVTRAVNKNEANRLTEEGVAHRFKRDNDKRRLYLLQEGTIATNSPLYELLPPSERTMREASAKQRKQLIESNPSLHLSLTRLSVRNIPRVIDSRDLRQLAREAYVGFAKDCQAGRRSRLSKEELARGGPEMAEAERERKTKAKGICRQAKIVFEGEKGGKVDEKTGAGRSRGYGFIEYHTHRAALMALRWLNGHQIDYTALEQEKGKNSKGKSVTKEVSQERKKRLIVEFAIENAQVVKRRSEIQAKAREHAKNPVEDEKDFKGKNGKGRGKDDGKKRKRGQAEEEEEAEEKVKPEDAEKVAKRSRIIQQKRMQRRAKKNGKK